MEYNNEFEQSAHEYQQQPLFTYGGSFPETIDPALLQRSDSLGLPSLDDYGENYLAPADPAPLLDSALDYFFEEQGPESQGLPNLSLGVNPGGLAHAKLAANDVICTFPACGHAFSSKDALRDHMDSTHAEQHLVVSKNPFKCHCGMKFAKLYTLERHIQGQNKDTLRHPCPECTAYQGKNGFPRKDHLKQHLIHGHGYDDHRVAALFPPRKAGKVSRVCRFEGCEYNPRQKTNRRFSKQSEYTAHMKREHDWSPLACNVAGCEKSGGKGFFSSTALEKHRNQKHPGTTVSMPTVRDSVEKTLKCSYCLKELGSKSSLRDHEYFEFTTEVECDLCRELVQLGHLQYHKSWRCKGEVACLYCHKRMESCKLRDHERGECEGMTKCWGCLKSVERRTMTYDGRSCRSCRKW